MLKRTHLAIGLGIVLYFLDLPQLNNKLIFSIVVLIASLLPALETAFVSVRQRRGIFSFARKLEQPNGILHTYTVCIFVSVILAFFYPIYAFPFFLGYSFHLFVDAFTPRGIQPFWPYKERSKGHVHPGGRVDMIIFYVMLVVDLALFAKLFI